MVFGTAESLTPEVLEAEEIWQPDFRVENIRSSIWQVAILSKRGSDWARAKAKSNLLGKWEKVTTTDVAGINDLIGHARSNGLKVEYIGPHQVVRF